MSVIMEFAKEIRAKLLLNGIDLSEPVEIGIMDFEGSGDSGYINDFEFSRNELSDLFLEYKDDLNDWGNEILDSILPGWEINEGSRGSIQVLLDSDEMIGITEIDIYTESVHNENSSGSILLEEDEDCWAEIVKLWSTHRPEHSGKLKIVLTFDGSGDDGAIDDPVIFETDKSYIWDNGSICNDFMDLKLQNGELVSEEICGWAYDVLDEIGLDWCNNAGGSGYIAIFIDDIDDGSIRYDWSIDCRLIDSYAETHEQRINIEE
jgi:hypothetical protein